jgi:hypothetical protein
MEWKVTRFCEFSWEKGRAQSPLIFATAGMSRDRFQEDRTALPAVGQDPPPEVDTFARPSNCAMSAAEKGEVQEDDCVRRAKASLHNVKLSQVAIDDPSVRRDKQVLSGYPLIPRRSNKAGSPEKFVQFHDRKASNLSQAYRESRFA